MSPHLPNLIFFSFAVIAASAMMIEGCLIVLLKKQITPLPTRILVGLGMLTTGKVKSMQQFAGRTSPKVLRAYAACVLVFGPIIFISSFVFLFTAVL